MLPELAHWFAITPDMVNDLTPAEAEEFLQRLNDCPPIGGVLMFERR